MDAPLQLTAVSYKSGSYIIVEGKQDADRFYIIQQGKIGLSKEVEVAQEESHVLNPGDLFGVISTMSGHSHIETAQALTDVVLLTVHKEQFGALIQKKSQVAMKIIIQFSKRLRHLNETLAGISLEKPAESGPEHLFEVAEYYFSQKQYRKSLYIYNRYLKHCPEGEKADAAEKRIASMRSLMTGSSNDTEYKADDLKRTYSKDTILFVEGEPGDELFIIQKGSVKISKVAKNNEVLLAVLKAGDIFGEMALLEGKPRAATASTYEDCDVMVVNRSNFEVMITTQPQLIARVTSLLADRIWLIYKQLANTLIDDPLGRMYDSLLIQLEKNRVSLTEAKPYTFSFGQWELANMVGLNEKKAAPILSELMKNEKIKIVDGNVQVSSVLEIVKQVDYYRRMDQRKKAQLKSQQERA